jgi:glycosyltransferase involved in cell wall biosynthesis/serine acetyltransferase
LKQSAMLNPVSYYRLARWLYLRRIPLLPRVIGRLSVLLFHCYIPCTVEIGEGFEVGYWGMGIVIHPQVKIGRNVFVAHGVTIGGRNESPNVPRIEENVYIATGAKVLGDVTIGSGSIIGANAVVIRTVPPRSIAVGIPARISRENIDVREYTGWPKSPVACKGQSEVRKSPPASESGARVFHMVNSLDMGGSEHQMVEVALRQRAAGYHVVVGCLSLKGPLLAVLRQAGVTVVEFNPKGGFFRPSGIYQIVRLTWYLRGHPCDVVQAHDLYSTLLGVPAAWLARVPVILSSRRDLAHWWWYTPRRRNFLRHIQSLSTFVIANSQAVRDFLVHEDGFDPSLIRVVRNGVDFEKFANAVRVREKLFPDLPREAKLIAVVANMNVATKGHLDLIHAAAEVCRDYPETIFLLIGDGAERPRIESMAGELGLRHSVRFLGRRNDVPLVLACCDLSVLASWAEGLPNSVLEAMAAGLPVVATRVGGTPEIIEDEVSGLLVPPRNSHALAQAILRLLRDPNLAQALARAARERAQLQFSFERLLSELDNLYTESRQRKGGLPYTSEGQGAESAPRTSPPAGNEPGTQQDYTSRTAVIRGDGSKLL